MDKLRVAFTHVFFHPDGSPAWPGYDIAPLKAHRRIEIKVLQQTPLLAAGDLAGVDVLVTSTGETKVSRESLADSRRLTLIARAGAGYDDVDISACTEKQIAVANASEAVRRPTAVATLALILAATTRLIQKHRVTRAGPRDWWRLPELLSIDLEGRILGLVGLGSIGSEVARLVAPLGMRIIAHDPLAAPEAAARLGVRLVDLETLLREADVVSLHVTLNETSRHLINAERLQLMKPTAFLINAARGKVVDQKALTECLRSGKIAGAGLDVLEQEPPAADDPLLQLDNVVLSAHALAWTDTLDGRLAATNTEAILALAQGREPAGVVNGEVLKSPAWRRKLARLHTFAAAS
jgi:phosphoglycerate dehydrogenase-like enzyme